MNQRKVRELNNEAPGMSIEEIKAKYGQYITAMEFTTDKVYLLMGDASKVSQQELLWAGRALDKAGVWVLIAMMEPGALRVVELEKAPESEKPLILMPDRGIHSV